MATAITDAAELLTLLGLPTASADVDDGFPLRVPRYFAGLMRRGDPADPLLAQVLPCAAERLTVPGYTSDPVGDLRAHVGGGLIRKYRGRALAVVTGACAVHCRYCFRRHFPYAEHTSLKDWRGALATLRDMPDVDELILSGGDPLSLSDARLAALVDAAADVVQLRRLRIHTRLPVVLPGRVTARLCDILGATRLQAVVVIHANHPNEVTPVLAAALAPLRAAGIPLLNQAVLLKSVNDDADTLAELSESLFRAGVLPYYLHLLDPVAGAAHFDVPTARAKALHAALLARLPGYLVPRVVRETAGASGKTPLAPL